MTTTNDAVIARYDTHQAAENAIKMLIAAGFETDILSVVGRGYHTDEKVIGFYNSGDRVQFWGKQGAFWGGLWGLFLGGLVVTIPVAGPVVVLGYLATVAVSGIEGAAIIGGLSAIGAALVGMGVPRDSVIQYETEVAADSFLVMAHGFHDEVVRAHSILGTTQPGQISLHHDLVASASPAEACSDASPPERQMA